MEHFLQTIAVQLWPIVNCGNESKEAYPQERILIKGCGGLHWTEPLIFFSSVYYYSMIDIYIYIYIYDIRSGSLCCMNYHSLSSCCYPHAVLIKSPLQFWIYKIHSFIKPTSPPELFRFCCHCFSPFVCQYQAGVLLTWDTVSVATFSPILLARRHLGSYLLQNAVISQCGYFLTHLYIQGHQAHLSLCFVNSMPLTHRAWTMLHNTGQRKSFL